MKGRIVAFLGPTISAADAASCLEAIYSPPAEQGDIVRAVLESGARTIVLIDGAFATAPAVRHKEILWALARGVRIWGGASMGALRAAELYPYGMRGYGLIYRWYRSTLLADDDEVAVAMMPPELDAHALSDALIDIRLTLRQAARQAVIPHDVRRRMEVLAREMYFMDRTYSNLFDQAKAILPSAQHASVEALRGWVRQEARSQKRHDAIGLLRAVAAEGDNDGLAPLPESPAFRLTEAWATDLEAAGLRIPDIL